MEFTQDEIDDFKSDALEMLDGAEDDLLRFDKGGDFSSIYDAVFRVFHSIKGGAGMTGLVMLQEHMHKVENLLVQCKPSPKVMHSNVTFFLNGIDAARKILGGESVKFEYALQNFEKTQAQNTTASPSMTALSTPAATPSPSVALANVPTELSSNLTTQLQTNNGINAFVVDDEPEILEILCDILKDAGISAQSFDTPQKMFDALAVEKPDVILTDMMMPEINGLQVLTRVKAMDPDIPVIFVSGHLSKSVLMSAVSEGVHGVVEKPIQESVVVSQCVAAARQYQFAKLLKRSLSLLIYQYSDLDNFLASQGREEVRRTLKNEIENILNLRRMMQKRDR